jgi:hypothetical protein
MRRTSRLVARTVTYGQKVTILSACCSSPAGHPAKPLVSFRINRQISGWNLPPLMIRAFEAHCHERT